MLKLDTINDPRLIEALQSGAVGVMPADTLYGLVCRAADKQAVDRLYDIKPRRFKPGTLIAANVDQLVELGIPHRYLKPVQHFWPNSLSVVVPTSPELGYLNHNLGTLPVRIPAVPQLRTLLEKTGPLQTTSANLPDKPPANTVAEAEKSFGDRVDFYVDGGDLSGRPPSTIIKVVDDEIEILRQGAVKLNELGEIIS